MARLLALEWDTVEARVIVATIAAARVTVEDAFAIPLLNAQGASLGEGKARTERLAAALAARSLSKLDVLVAVGRSSTEIRTLQTPPVPDGELADIVRFQAVREFSSLGEDWPLDFVPLVTHEGGGRTVLAATLSTETIAEIRTLCEGAGLRLTNVVLRPFAAASLLPKKYDDQRHRLLVDILPLEADLTVLSGRDAVFPRTVRLPAEGEESPRQKAILSEVRRTMVAARNQFGGGVVEQMVVFGQSSLHEPLRQALTKEFGNTVTVESLDPFSAVEVPAGADFATGLSAGAYAPLLGMLLDQAAERPHAIDFLHPRKRPLVKDYRKLFLQIGAGLGAIAAVLLLWMVWELRSRDAEIADLTKELNKQEALAKKGEPVRLKAEKIDEFLAIDLTLLDELAELSQEFPSAKVARVDDLTVGSLGQGKGLSLGVRGFASDSKIIADLEAKLRDSRHTVFGSGAKESLKNEGFKWGFNEEIHLALPGEESEETATPTAPTANKATSPAATTKTAATSKEVAAPKGGK